MVQPFEHRMTLEEIAEAERRYFEGYGTLMPRPPRETEDGETDER